MTSFSYAETRKSDSLEPIAKAFDESDSDTMVLLDIGGTLLAYRDPVLHKAHEKWTKEWFQRNLPNLTKEEKVALVHIVEQETKNWCLVDELWPVTITKAQSRGAKVVAFTKTVLGPSLKGMRAKKLAAFGLPIKNDLPSLASCKSFEYADGIIETESELKGPVLDDVLLSLAQKPHKIIFVDDRIEQIQSVEAVCAKHNIPCLAFHYTSTEHIPELNDAVADYQLHMLVDHHKWVSTPEVLQELSL